MGMPPMNRPPMGGDMGAAPAPGGQGGGMDFVGSLQQLQQELPPEMQSKLDPNNPITQLLFKRLRDGISEEEGQALLQMFASADRLALSGWKKVLPEIVILLDIFDDGELNDSVGEVDAGDGMGGPPAPGGSSAPRGRPETAQAAPRPAYETDDDDDEDEGYGGSLSRLSQVRG